MKCLQEVLLMAKIYANLIRKGFKTIDDVPVELLEEVKQILGIE